MLRRALALLAALTLLPAAPAQAAPITPAAPMTPAAPVAAAAPAPVDLVGLDFQVVNAGSGWCLTSGLTELPCARTDPYRWRFRPVAVANELELLSVRTNRCLAMPGATRIAGARAGLEPCAPAASRRWALRDSLGETAKIVNTATGQCLQIESGVAVQGSCAGTAGSRRWTVRVLSVPIPGLM
ncbi:RICIN domain-containing protein [Actinoplanes sp. TRM 88003]|uniref:RICIN domain-containing protein n=1 Tax=Paractinoplanes aksuensis TaxID=2939490 RepID=A0ABT1DYR6_9ACTN|nr:RICIN domain-containing protein [Actinoplanes aksuensis]MCO8275932.1 RICIN domain-containing protein [Actinoplanes aksuensis]